jgi:L-ribulose-5-phosphate 4-epimerase
MALLTQQVNPAAVPLPEHIVRKHYLRKHGPNAYYGQK